MARRSLESILAFALALLAPAHGLAGVAGGNFSNLPVRPPDVSLSPTPTDWETANGGHLFPGAGGFTSPFGPIVSSDGIGNAIYEFPRATIGASLSQQSPDYQVGDYCDIFPAAVDKIDWPATARAILSSESCRKGYVAFFPSEKAEKRLLFTRNGSCSIRWVLTDGSHLDLTYTIGLNTSRRPFRLFWTESPYKAPRINLQGKNVKLFGDPGLISPRYEVTVSSSDPYVATSNVVEGVYLDLEVQSLRAFASGGKGPEGQFVLVYYSVEGAEVPDATVVVQVGPPDCSTLRAKVGDELRPYGGGYSVSNLTAYVLKGFQEQGSTYSPYIYQYAAISEYAEKDGAVFAIVPTDGSTDGKDPSPWNIDICWLMSDPMGTMWPFEEDWYLVEWPEEMPVMVAAKDRGSASPAFIGREYSASLCAYNDREKEIAMLASNRLVCVDSGRFTLQLMTDSSVWFVPIRSVLRDDGSVFELSEKTCFVGSEILPVQGKGAGRAESVAATIDRSLPGFLYCSEETGNNYNPRLYHVPELLPSPIPEGPSDGDPFESLVSSIYPVNIHYKPLEVWWFRSYGKEDMPTPIQMPTIVQRFRARWPSPGDTHDIVLASEKGSAAPSVSADGAALLFADASAAGTVPLAPFDGLYDFTIFFRLAVAPHAAGLVHPPEDGTLLSLETADGGRLRFGVEDASTSPRLTVVLEDADGAPLSSLFALFPRDEWRHVCLAVDPGDPAGPRFIFGTNLVGRLPPFSLKLPSEVSFGAAGGGQAAPRGTALDSLAIIYGAATPKKILHHALLPEKMLEGERVLLDLAFDGPGDLLPIPASGEVYAHDEALGKAASFTGVTPMRPGAPSVSRRIFAAEGGVRPEIYRNPVKGTAGYNPNEEHAFLTLESEGYVAWALRNDLNILNYSDAFVLVIYNDGGKGAMAILDVQTTSPLYPAFESTVVAGHPLDGPHPIVDLPDPLAESTYILADDRSDPDGFPVYRDRSRRLWARRDGAFRQYCYYRVREDFDFPGFAEQPAVGTEIGWMNCTTFPGPDLQALTTLPPLPWHWKSIWPATNAVPTMRVAQTLTKAVDGLPEVWSCRSLAVAYPSTSLSPRAPSVVDLIDPTVARTAPLEIKTSFPDEYGFTLGSSGNCRLRTGKYYLSGLPPTISDRFFIDPNAPEAMTLVGRLDESAAGLSCLHLNILSTEERKALKDICRLDPGSKGKKAWDAAVDSLARGAVVPSVQRNDLPPSSTKEENAYPSADYLPADHYALVANGSSDGWVTLIENDNPDTTVVPEGAVVSMHLLRVVPELHAAPLVVHEDPGNKLSEKLSILYSAPFGEAADDFVFEWRKAYPPADGKVPEDYLGWEPRASAPALTELHLGGEGASLAELVNTYYVMRYQAKEGTAARRLLGDRWSDWCGPTLAEGWVQRVLKNVTPFAQRLDDFYENPCELSYTMPAQIGGPYRGDVALNNENLGDVGLLELYQTVLNKAESLSLQLGVNDPNANKQLMEASSRLADLYGLLGDDAYSDAMNPTIGGCALGGKFSDRKITMPGSVFCFDNQLPSLLDEELALLRGRSAAVAPKMTTYPCYNRLMWNFTSGITEGELAYVINYNILGSGGEISEEQAALQYPMGHGDAYGHYLSGLWGYYRLLRNPFFAWGEPGMMEMLVADSIVNMDYEDEQKFASLAEKLARTGMASADLTARKCWRDQGGKRGAGYFDENDEQAFGYGQWAVRSGLGAFYNWATVNSLLPDDPTNGVYRFTDKSIAKVDRSTVPALATLAERFAEIQRSVDRADRGANPLGLSDNAVPFDIDPDAPGSHFEQILDRTKRALRNAKAVLDHANLYAGRMDQILRKEGDDASSIEAEERAFNNELISIYGTPWGGDIGAGGTYPQGYEGPDLYHYMWTDLTPYGLSDLKSSFSTNITLFKALSGLPYSGGAFDPVPDGAHSISVRYEVAPGGIILKPASIRGARRVEGSVQDAYRDYLAAYVEVIQAQATYAGRVGGMVFNAETLSTRLGMGAASLAGKEALAVLSLAAQTTSTILNQSMLWLDGTRALSDEVLESLVKAIPKIVGAGLTVNYDPQSVGEGVKGGIKVPAESIYWATKFTAGAIGTTLGLAADEAGKIMGMLSAGYDYYGRQVAWYKESVGDVVAIRSAAYDLQNAIGKLSAAEAAYRAEVAKGEALLSEREMRRQHRSNDAVSLRYQEMFLRVQRNTVLSQYKTAFDTAQRYVYQLAKVYDYETGLLSSDKQAGDRFLREIVATRSLGTERLAFVQEGRDGGLWDIVTRMADNWEVLKGRLGVNNPETATRWFSLRYSLFRISPGADGDVAWERELRKYWCDDLLANREFARYCQPPVSASGHRTPEPGLVIPFSTSINVAENFFGKPLLGGETTYSSSDYATKIRSAGVSFDGYNVLEKGYGGRPALADSPNVYLVPVGTDYMRSPAGTTDRKIIGLPVVDQVLPVPYAVGSTELDDESWISTMKGFDGTADAFVTIRRHSTLAEGEATTSTRLAGRSVWNDRWLLVIPASSLHSDRKLGLETFLHGADLDGDGVRDQRPVSDIRLGLRTYSRSGN